MTTRPSVRGAPTVTAVETVVKDVTVIVAAMAAKEERAVVADVTLDYHGPPTRRPARISWARAEPCGM